MTDVEIWTIDTWQERTNNELNQLKKEMIERIVDKMKENNQDDAFLHVGKDIVVDYLLDEWENTDKVNDFFLWIGINLLSSSADQLKDLREKIKNSNTKEELEILEKSVIENLNNSWDDQTQSWTSGSSGSTSSAWTTSSSWSGSSESTDSSSIEVSVDSARVGEAKEVPLKQRMQRLFPEWVPTREKDMKKYITKIKVPILTANWKKKKLTLHVHKKLANEYKAIFQEMYDRKIPVNPDKTWWYNWRKMRRWKKLSHHSYGSAVDVNWDVNGWVYGTTDRNSPYYNGNDTVAIRKKHGFYRWWDWSARSDDPMHFTYMNG